MSFRQLRNVWKFCISIGIGFLSIGVFYFMNYDNNSHLEKVGTVLMMYSGIFLGIGFTALITLKSK